jgi:hypothetical protein
MYELSLPPKPGEILFFVELSRVENMTIAECLTMLQLMGYQPELKYRQWNDADGIQHIGLFALLKHEKSISQEMLDSDYMFYEWSAIAQLIKPSEAVCCPRGLPKRVAIAA